MTTRLDRLLLLLDTGSTPVIRRTAAQQLGEVQKLHPHELKNLLNRVHVHLRSNNWDTRIAAGEAIDAIASNVPDWKPEGLPVKCEKDSDGDAVSKNDALMFDKFDITHVIKHGEALLGSSGQEYDVFDEELLGLDVKERLARQQELLRRRLGLVPGVDSGMDIVLDDEDILLPAHVVAQKSLQKQKSKEGQSTADLVAAEIAAISSSAGMSSREKNRAKRRAKVLAKQRSKENNSPVPSTTKEEKEGPPEKKLKHTSQVVVDQPEDPDKIVVDSVRDTTSWFEEKAQNTTRRFSSIQLIVKKSAEKVRQQIRVSTLGYTNNIGISVKCTLTQEVSLCPSWLKACHAHHFPAPTPEQDYCSIKYSVVASASALTLSVSGGGLRIPSENNVVEYAEVFMVYVCEGHQTRKDHLKLKMIMNVCRYLVMYSQHCVFNDREEGMNEHLWTRSSIKANEINSREIFYFMFVQLRQTIQ